MVTSIGKRMFAAGVVCLCGGGVQAAVTTSFQGNTLRASSDTGDTIILTTDGTNVKINGMDPTNLNDPGMPVAAGALGRIVLTAGPAGSTLDASGYPGAGSGANLFVPVEFEGGPGSDTILGSSVSDQVIAGPGDDSIMTGEGNDSVIWDVGDGADTIDLGGGTDRARFDGPGDPLVPFDAVFEDNGSGVARFRATSGAMETVLLQNVEELSFFGGRGDDSLTVTDLSATSAMEVRFDGSEGDDSLDASASTIPVLVEHRFREGNDSLIGGESEFDSLNVSPGSGDTDETYTISETGTTLTIAMTGSATLDIDAQGIESLSLFTDDGNDTVTIMEIASSAFTFLSVFTGSGDDTVSVVPSTTAEMNLNGSSQDTADTLIYDALGLPFMTDGNERTTLGRQPVLANDFENVQILNPQERAGDQWEL